MTLHIKKGDTSVIFQCHRSVTSVTFLNIFLNFF
nr:MAG TPA: hypothetical protein [Caudoviricetes sp.]